MTPPEERKRRGKQPLPPERKLRIVVSIKVRPDQHDALWSRWKGSEDGKRKPIPFSAWLRGRILDE